MGGHVSFADFKTPNKSRLEIPVILNDTFRAYQVTAGGKLYLLSTCLDRGLSKPVPGNKR